MYFYYFSMLYCGIYAGCNLSYFFLNTGLFDGLLPVEPILHALQHFLELGLLLSHTRQILLWQLLSGQLSCCFR